MTLRPSQVGFRTVHTGNQPHRPTDPQMVADAKAWGLAHGYQGATGGWVYDKDGQHIAHGWGQFYYAIGGQTIHRWLETQSKKVGE